MLHYRNSFASLYNAKTHSLPTKRTGFSTKWQQRLLTITVSCRKAHDITGAWKQYSDQKLPKIFCVTSCTSFTSRSNLDSTPYKKSGRYVPRASFYVQAIPWVFLHNTAIYRYFSAIPFRFRRAQPSASDVSSK